MRKVGFPKQRTRPWLVGTFCKRHIRAEENLATGLTSSNECGLRNLSCVFWLPGDCENIDPAFNELECSEHVLVEFDGKPVTISQTLLTFLFLQMEIPLPYVNIIFSTFRSLISHNQYLIPLLSHVLLSYLHLDAQPSLVQVCTEAPAGLLGSRLIFSPSTLDIPADLVFLKLPFH